MNYPGNFLEKTLFRTAGEHAEIRTKYLLNTNVECYKWDSMFITVQWCKEELS
ncbi:hypothetical protein B7P43_G00946 [Cryptotermes secundus]|uniref:Uncharacterized protein n=1 Tax=Cryptotermes secundus TaxID=105785 RepID=A0A2J7PFZ0_9NEOP|nr:hypothetical protein B7P43_G00946 [Cryptotermes secundus]